MTRLCACTKASQCTGEGNCDKFAAELWQLEKPLSTCRAPNGKSCFYPSVCRAGERDPSHDRCRYVEMTNAQTETANRLPLSTIPYTLEPHRHAAQILDQRFGIGKEHAHKAIRENPEAYRIYECAIEVIADLLEKSNER